MSAHTPGPWVVSNKGGMLNVSAPASGGALASLGIPKGEERFANARLIAAAPDLLAACEAVVSLLAVEGLKSPTVEVARAAVRKELHAAIAKAVGK